MFEKHLYLHELDKLDEHGMLSLDWQCIRQSLAASISYGNFKILKELDENIQSENPVWRNYKYLFTTHDIAEIKKYEKVW